MFYVKDIMACSEAYKRPYNQDRYFYMNLSGGPDRRNRISILAVLDGVSRANGGEASAMAEAAMRPILAELLGRCDELDNLDSQTRKDEVLRILRSAILAADRALCRWQEGELVYGTTITLAVVYQDRIYAANVGDSPAYLLPVSLGGDVSEPIALFECQNKAGEMVRAGVMTMEEAVASKLQNRLSCMAGGDPLREQEIYTTSTWLRQSCLLMLGSDGALSVAPEAELREIAQERLPSGLRAVVEGIFERVQNSDSTDNFTVLSHWLEQS